MNLYPIALRLEGRRCVVIGGGKVAARKVETLLASGAEILVISPKADTSIVDARNAQRLRLQNRPFREGDLDRAFLAIAATGSPQVNRDVAREARDRGVLVNIVDDPDNSDFHVPAQVQRGDLLLTVSTSGASPALAKRIRQELEKQFGPEYKSYLSLLRTLRNILQQNVPEQAERQRLEELFIERGDALGALKFGDQTAAGGILALFLKHHIDYGLRD